MIFLKTIFIIAMVYFGCIVVFDIAAVLLVTILPEPDGYRLNGHPGFGSVVLYYVVWFVAGSLSGASYTMASLEVVEKKYQMGNKPVIIFSNAIILSALLIFIFYAIDEMKNPHNNYNNNYYVPGHKKVTYVYFISFLIMCLLLLKMNKKVE